MRQNKWLKRQGSNKSTALPPRLLQKRKKEKNIREEKILNNTSPPPKCVCVCVSTHILTHIGFSYWEIMTSTERLSCKNMPLIFSHNKTQKSFKYVHLPD